MHDNKAHETISIFVTLCIPLVSLIRIEEIKLIILVLRAGYRGDIYSKKIGK